MAGKKKELAPKVEKKIKFPVEMKKDGATKFAANPEIVELLKAEGWK